MLLRLLQLWLGLPLWLMTMMLLQWPLLLLLLFQYFEMLRNA